MVEVHSEGRARRYVRRAFSIPLALSVAPLMVLFSPLIFPVLLLVDLFTAPRRLPLTRLGALAMVFAFHEWHAVFMYVHRAWLPQENRWDAMREAMGIWSGSLHKWAGYIGGLHFDWAEPSTMPKGHPLVIARHASNIDAIIPASLFAGILDRPAHHVLKSQLRWAPSMDLFAPPLGNYFVRRGRDTQAELRQVERLAEIVRPEGSLVIFPEGTFSTPETRAKVRASLARKGEIEAVALSDELKALLPPKPAGVLTLLNARPDCIPMVLAHTGLDNVASFKGLWQSLPLTEPVVVRWWPTAPPPTDRDDQVRWLQDEWRRADRWIASGSDELPALTD